MNFVNGQIISEEACQSILDTIDDLILETLQKPPLDINLVIDACDAMVKNIASLEITKRLPDLGISPVLAEMYINQVEQMFSAQAIRDRLAAELGTDYNKPKEMVYLYSGAKAQQVYAPLGVLFHITAGNMEVLPFVSLLEGLLCGNINIIKLPKEEQGITVSLLEALMKIQPALKAYVYAFDYSSKDLFAIKRLADVSDAIVVWGGDEAIKAVRTMANPNTRIIEWGHKISFAYATKAGTNKEKLRKLALNICLTNQLFCSSCQGVFLDTDDMDDVYAFCQAFLPVLEEVSKENPFVVDEGTKLFTSARVTLELYHKEIEARDTAIKIFKGENCSIIASSDEGLETSVMYRNIWVKPLRREKILALRRYKNYLQTAALLCDNEEYESLADQLVRAGVVKVSDGFEMSNYAAQEAHDGVFALRCYLKLVSVQKDLPSRSAMGT